MSDRLRVHPDHPAPRPLSQAADRLRAGELGVLPSDAGYLLAWMLEAREAEHQVQRMRRLDSRHLFTLLCGHLAEIGRLARLSDPAFRQVKALIPGPYTFILPTGAGLPKRLKQAKRKAIGCRVPDHAVTRGLLDIIGEPLLSTSLLLPDESFDNHDSEAVAAAVLHRVGFMLDAEDCTPGPTSVVDLTGETPKVIRPGWKPLVLD